MLLSIFPTKIHKVENFLNQSDIDDIILKIKSLSHTNHDAIMGNATSSHSQFSNFLKETDVEKKINLEIAKYCASCGYVNNKLSLCWANIQKKDSLLKMHNHGKMPITGALFLKTDKDSSKLCFENPNPYSKIMKYNVANIDLNTVCFEVQIGDLFLFPGWLMHGSNYEYNKSDERIVLSFNCTYMGE